MPRATPHFPHRHSGCGFTLVEMLLAVAIVGILATIIVPVVGKMRQNAQSSRCVSGMRSIGTAVQTFVVENDGRYPVADTAATSDDKSTRLGHWYVQIAPYLGANFPTNANEQSKQSVRLGYPIGCPSAPMFDAANDVKSIGSSYGWTSVSISGQMPRLQHGPLVTEIINPGNTIMISERWGKNTNNSRDFNWNVRPPNQGSPAAMDSDQTSNGAADPGTLRVSHGGQSHFLFFDGHVEKMAPMQTYSGTLNYWRGQ